MLTPHNGLSWSVYPSQRWVLSVRVLTHHDRGSWMFQCWPLTKVGLEYLSVDPWRMWIFSVDQSRRWVLSVLILTPHEGGSWVFECWPLTKVGLECLSVDPSRRWVLRVWVLTSHECGYWVLECWPLTKVGLKCLSAWLLTKVQVLNSLLLFIFLNIKFK